MVPSLDLVLKDLTDKGLVLDALPRPGREVCLTVPLVLMMPCGVLSVLVLMLTLCSPAFINTEHVNVQEKLILSSMGLSSRPRPSHHAPVPSLLWKIFRKSSWTSHTDPCVVSEYSVPGNIVRFIQDQGEAFRVCSIIFQN